MARKDTNKKTEDLKDREALDENMLEYVSGGAENDIDLQKFADRYMEKEKEAQSDSDFDPGADAKRQKGSLSSAKK
jgi:hypothetical protein